MFFIWKRSLTLLSVEYKFKEMEIPVCWPFSFCSCCRDRLSTDYTRTLCGRNVNTWSTRCLWKVLNRSTFCFEHSKNNFRVGAAKVFIPRAHNLVNCFLLFRGGFGKTISSHKRNTVGTCNSFINLKYL